MLVLSFKICCCSWWYMVQPKTGTDFLILPSRWRLGDYKNYIRPKRGFNNEIISELLKKTENVSENEKFCSFNGRDESSRKSSLGKTYWRINRICRSWRYQCKLWNISEIKWNCYSCNYFSSQHFQSIQIQLGKLCNLWCNWAPAFCSFWKAVSICEWNGLKVLVVIMVLAVITAVMVLKVLCDWA